METLVLLTIIAEETLTSSIEKTIIEIGAKGYTYSSVSGKGLSGLRDNQWEGENVKIETITSQSTCQKILDHLENKYFDRYAMVVFYHPVNVKRTEHFI